MIVEMVEFVRRATSIASSVVIFLPIYVMFLTASSWAEEAAELQGLERIHLSNAIPLTSNSSLPFLRQSMMLSFQPTYFTALVTPGRLKDVGPDFTSPSSRGMSASSAWLDGRLKTDTEIAFPDATRQLQGLQQNTGQQMWRLTVHGSQGAFRYGASYRTAGKAYVEAPNQSLPEVWGEYVFGSSRLRTSVGETWNNVDGDPTVLRLTQTYGRVGWALVHRQWPELTLTYTRASVVNSLLSGGTASQDAATDTVAATLGFTKSQWQIQLASSYLMSDNRLAGARKTTGLVEAFTASYRPSNTFTVTSSLGYRSDIDQWSGARVQTPSASVSINYRASQSCSLSALGGYSVANSNSGTTNLESVNSRALLAWTFPTMPFMVAPPIVAIEASYTLTANYAAASPDLQDLSGLVRLIVEEF